MKEKNRVPKIKEKEKIAKKPTKNPKWIGLSRVWCLPIGFSLWMSL